MENPYNTGHEKGSSVLGPTLKFKGELKADEDLLVRGTIEGSIQHSSNLKIGREGKIKAEVNAEYIEVHGTVNGNLTGSKSVVVKESANVSGNIFSPSVSLHEGARFNGSIDMSGAEKTAAKPAEKPAQKTQVAQKPETSEQGEAVNDDDAIGGATGKRGNSGKTNTDAA